MVDHLYGTLWVGRREGGLFDLHEVAREGA